MSINQSVTFSGRFYSLGRKPHWVGQQVSGRGEGSLDIDPHRCYQADSRWCFEPAPSHLAAVSAGPDGRPAHVSYFSSVSTIQVPANITAVINLTPFYPKQCTVNSLREQGGVGHLCSRNTSRWTVGKPSTIWLGNKRRLSSLSDPKGDLLRGLPWLQAALGG